MDPKPLPSPKKYPGDTTFGHFLMFGSISFFFLSFEGKKSTTYSKGFRVRVWARGVRVRFGVRVWVWVWVRLRVRVRVRVRV